MRPGAAWLRFQILIQIIGTTNMSIKVPNAVVAAVAAERLRISTILQSAEAEGRTKAAIFFACSTPLDAEQAIEALKHTPREEAKSAGSDYARFVEDMAAYNTDIMPAFTAGPAHANPEAARKAARLDEIKAAVSPLTAR